MRAKKFTFHRISFLIALSAASLVGWALSYFSGLSFWIAFFIVIAAMLINGFIAEVEDNAPGGFNNPLPPAQPKSPTTTSDDSTKSPNPAVERTRYAVTACASHHHRRLSATGTGRACSACRSPFVR
ncbi:MAG: hypothetical protein M3436_20765 [Pseudomonadota bacterium]|nr:hypothetical protein [Pseudomonadota bacterium]